MTTAFMAESAVRDKYGFTASDTFEGKFSKVSIEGLLFYVVAFGIWVLEKLFDTHKEEVSTMLADLTPHTTRWYRNRVLSMVPSGQEEPPVKGERESMMGAEARHRLRHHGLSFCD